MKTLPTPPSKGDRISAALIRDLIRAIRERTPLAGSGVRLKYGPNGVTINAAATRGGVAANPAKDVGVYQITETTREVEGGEEGETEVVHTFAHPYVMVGGILCECPVDTVLEDLLPNAGDDGKLFLALRISATPAYDLQDFEVLGFGTLAELAAAQADTAYHHIPLYLLAVTKTENESDDEDADSTYSYTYTVVCDFRLMVHAQQWEVQV